MPLESSHGAAEDGGQQEDEARAERDPPMLLSGAASGGSSWEDFVAHNWLPVLSLALGPSWREQFDSEVAAMVALQLALQPDGSSKASASSGTASNGSGTSAPFVSLPSAQSQPSTVARCAAATTAMGLPAGAAALAPGAVAPRTLAVEAVDVDGKRRRLRRKRAASPDESPSGSPTAAGAASSGGAPKAAAAVAASAADRPADGGEVASGGGTEASGTVDAGSKQDNTQSALVQRVIRQVSKLSLSPASEASSASHAAGTGTESTTRNASEVLSPTPGHASGGSSEPARVVGKGGGGGGGGIAVGAQGSDGDVAATAAAPHAIQMQRGLLDSLSLVHDLSQRIVTNLQSEVKSRGLSLPPQLQPPGAAMPKGPADQCRSDNSSSKGVSDGGSSGEGNSGAAEGGGSSSLPLSVLLGGSLVDRMDLLGRTALHIAAATGRADVVHQLAAAGAAVNKALPMDYRALLRGQQGQRAQNGTVADGQPVGGEVTTQAAEAGSAISEHELGGDWNEAVAEEARGRAPPPKRGRYVTAGPAAPGLPSLQYCTALHCAALGGHLEAVQALLAISQYDVGARNIEGSTALHLAALAGHTQVVAALARAPGAQLDAPDLQGRTALHLAAARGHGGVVTELWARGAAIDACDLHGWTALHYASRAGHAEVALQLVIAGSLVSASDPHGITAAHLAAERGFADILERCLCAGYVVDSVAGPLADGSEGGTALHLAAAQGCEEVAMQLLEAGADPRHLDYSGRNALDLAVLHGHLALVEPLLERGCWFTSSSGDEEQLAQPRAGEPGYGQLQQLYCLASAVPQEHPAWADVGDGSQLLVESFRLTFAECAARAGRLDILQELQRRGLDLRGRAGCAVLAAAVHSGAAPLVRWLVGPAGCNVAAALKQEDLLHEAASRGDVDVLAALLQAAGPTCLCRTDGRGLGRTPLHSAIIHGQQDTAELLICQLMAAGRQTAAPQGEEHAARQQGVEGDGTSTAAVVSNPAAPCPLDAADQQGYTALHWAALKGSTALVRRLLAAGASREAAAADQLTPLHLSAKSGHVPTVHALLAAGASVTATDAHGWMPLHYVALCGDLALFVLLFSPSAPSLAAAGPTGAALLTAAIRGGSSEMVGILLLTGATTPQKCREAGQMPVHAAAREGCLDVLQFLYGAGFDMTELDSERKSPLHHVPIGAGQAGLAARRGANHAQAAEVLLAFGCRVDSQDAHGCTPIHFAAGAGAVAMLGRFLDLAPSAADAPDSISWTPLFWACNNGHAAAAERLLAEGANPWNRDCNQRLPLHFAAEAGHTACLRLLVQRMRCSRDPAAPPGSPVSLDVPDQNGQTPVQLASEHGHPECAALLLDADGTGEAKRRTALHLAAAQGQLEIAKQVLATRRLAVSAKDADGWLPIHCAAAAGHADIVAALLGAGSDCDEPAADGDTPLHKAATAGHLPVVQLLKARSGLDPRNSAGSTPLYNAASQGHLAVMRVLLQEGAAVDATTTNGCSPLYIAANNGCAQAAALLLESGADPDLETTSGCTPLHAAALNGHARVVRHLVAAGCDIDAQSQNGSSALHNAASGGHTEVVEVLLAGGADSDVQNSNGNTPLHLAAGKGWLDVAERLAAAGADPHIKNGKGWLAIQSASNSGYFEVVLKLVQHGSPWRLKGEADVVKLLGKKTSYKPGYIEGRLRIADRERVRRLAKQQAAAGSGGPEAGSGAGAGSEQELRQAAAQADAAMAELLEAEEADKERAERAKQKKAAKKLQRAAKRAQQQEEEAQRQREEEEAQRRQQAEQQAQQARKQDQQSGMQAVDAAALEAAAKLLAAAQLQADGKEPAARSDSASSRSSSEAGEEAAPPPQSAKSKRQQRQQQESGTAPAPSKSAAATPVKSAGKAGAQAGNAASSPARSVLTVALKSPPAAANRRAGRATAAAVVRQAPPARSPAVAAAKPAAVVGSSMQPQIQQQRADTAPAEPANSPAAASSLPVSRPAPWAAVAAARAATAASTAAAPHLHQQPVVATPPQLAPGITRPVHLTAAGPAVRTAAPWSAPPAPVLQHPPVPSAQVLTALHGANAPGAAAPLEAHGAAPLGLQQAMAALSSGTNAQQLPQPELSVLSSPAAAGFVPLFGLSLPSFQGLAASVDWSMPSSSPSSATFGSPAPQLPTAFAVAPPLPLAPAAQLPAAAPLPPVVPGPAFAAAGFVGSFSPSDASSIESSDADDLLTGLHSHVGRFLPGGASVAAGMLAAGHTAIGPYVPIGPAAAGPPPAAADADSIDDVLRLQPWLQE